MAVEFNETEYYVKKKNIEATVFYMLSILFCFVGDGEYLIHPSQSPFFLFESLSVLFWLFSYLLGILALQRFFFDFWEIFFQFSLQNYLWKIKTLDFYEKTVFIHHHHQSPSQFIQFNTIRFIIEKFESLSVSFL